MKRKIKLYFNFKYIFIISLIFINLFQISIKTKKEQDKSKNNNLKVCLCLLCKKENLYIRYFVDIYKKLGFNHIFLYDNNDINGEKIENIISNEIKQNYISVINYRGFRGNYGGPQMAAYYDCYEKNNLFYDWIAFFDVDEYLELIPKNISIQDFLNNSRYKNCESIKINWKVFTDNNQLYYEDKPLNERFPEEINQSQKINGVRKVIIRGNLLNYSQRKSFNPHSIFKSNKSCDSNGKIREGYFIEPPEYKYAILNHYVTKTIKEFCDKIKKGHSFFNRILDNNLINYYFHYFFKYNKKTKEKISIFNNEFNTTFK